VASKKIIGIEGEDLAEVFFKEKGYHILARNYRTPYGEIELAISKGEDLVFVEVKTRINLSFGYGEEGINLKKTEHLISSAECYLAENKPLVKEWRIDVLAILMEGSGINPEFGWFENAV